MLVFISSGSNLARNVNPTVMISIHKTRIFRIFVLILGVDNFGVQNRTLLPTGLGGLLSWDLVADIVKFGGRGHFLTYDFDLFLAAKLNLRWTIIFNRCSLLLLLQFLSPPWFWIGLGDRFKAAPVSDSSPQVVSYIFELQVESLIEEDKEFVHVMFERDGV
ncbi:unnamed protein product [Microthlaspi erraticum]|uniref:Uncharacterized protein n=1 Tax=Microthlaspi erraticum TaxID=1685480 RepID=A0A6D2ICM6_9BRAS|nr:unnamed protein product [Microthlaspi erraticum]